jgi:serine/threonine protein kinase
MPWRLFVIDGADEGRFFPLAEARTLTIGNSHKHADICLHDLYVARVHCQVAVADNAVVVADIDRARGTFVNGQKVARYELHSGDVLRVGNSHLRLEPYDGVVPEASTEEHKLPDLASGRLGELSGYTLDHFDLGPVIGRGHSGIVFRADDLKAGEPVALKVLNPDFPAGAGEMQRFAQAVKTVMPLRHPNLVSVLGGGKAGPYCWIALELVEGESLAQVLAQRPGKGSWKAALRLAIHLARALDFAYHQHTIHGNLTPANVLWRANDKQFKLNDLVLDKALSGSALQLAILETKLLVELPYLAPEQMPGEGVIDCCTDLYGLGALVYARLTGRPPFEAPSPADTIDMICTATPVRPRDYLESIPSPFEAVVMRLLAKAQEDRYLTPAELLAELEPLADFHGVKV